VGDFIVGVMGREIKDVLRDPTNSESFARYIGTLSRPLTLTTYREIDEAAAPTMITQSSIFIAAGQAFKQPVYAPKGCDVRFKFWVEEEGCDINFSIAKEGVKDLVYPYMKVYSREKPCGPSKLTMDEDSNLTFVFDNSHSWMRGKSLCFTIHVHPAQSPGERKSYLEGESTRILRVKKLVEQKIASTEAQLKQERHNLAELETNLVGVHEEMRTGTKNLNKV